MGVRKRFSQEFKLSVIEQLGSRPIAELCREHNIQQQLINRWKREYESNPKQAFSGHGKAWKEEALIAQYERKIGQQAMQIDLLKKNVEHLEQRRSEDLRMRRSIIKKDYILALATSRR